MSLELDQLIPDEGARVTSRHFAGLGYRNYADFMVMHDEESRAEASTFYLNDHGDELKAAIISGRQPKGQGWLIRGRELESFERGLARGLSKKYGEFEAELLAAGVTIHTASELIRQVAEGIDQDRPY